MQATSGVELVTFKPKGNDSVIKDGTWERALRRAVHDKDFALIVVVIDRPKVFGFNVLPSKKYDLKIENAAPSN